MFRFRIVLVDRERWNSNGEQERGDIRGSLGVTITLPTIRRVIYVIWNRLKCLGWYRVNGSRTYGSS